MAGTMNYKKGDLVWFIAVRGKHKKLTYVKDITKDHVLVTEHEVAFSIKQSLPLISSGQSFQIEPVTNKEKLEMLIGTMKNGIHYEVFESHLL